MRIGRTLNLMILIVLSTSIGLSQSSLKLEVGSKLPPQYLRLKVGQMATAASQLRPFIVTSIKGVEYTIAYDERTRRIKYINTDDDNFRTSNGLKVDDEISFTVEELDI